MRLQRSEYLPFFLPSLQSSQSVFLAKFSEFFFCRVDDVISSFVFLCESKSFCLKSLWNRSQQQFGNGLLAATNNCFCLFFPTCSLLILQTVSSCERSDSTITAFLRWIVCPLRGFLYSSCSVSVKTGAAHVYLPKMLNCISLHAIARNSVSWTAWK